MTKLDHIIFKQNGYIAIEKAEKSKNADALDVDHHNCRLGKWYYQGSGYDNFRNTSAYISLDTSHSHVHSFTQKAYKISRGNWIDESHLLNEIVGCMQKAEDASALVMDAIDAMVEEKYLELNR